MQSLLPPHSRPKPSKASNTGFTLLELIIALSAIVILAVIVAVGAAGIQARVAEVKCLSNIRSYGIALLAYSAEHGGIPPTTGDRSSSYSFLNLLMPRNAQGSREPGYLGREMKCPLRKITAPSRNDLCYAGNVNLAIYYPTLKGLPVPSSKVVLFSEMYTGSGFWSLSHLNSTIACTNGKPTQAPWTYTPQWHGDSENRGIHIFCLDGHATLMRSEGNDFANSPTFGKIVEQKYNGGYFYHNGQFSAMSRGLLRAD